ncbi:hypothetical protein QKT49_gp115 [Acanthamoeba castellanii medusavirus]|uniref:Uncharacterized protein n=1 Tax=Acanthamoeba castellanii medusavirus J1 TaxID=3114988 RepID=A0A3T1CWS2_9VIRU|nr:hypothetical protein QKT49_gp115 [Acanthamoeba castellanii medusavirus]BBI30255.1 hypothetical protein [Acanthamoeba castellanii medusavirus J1]
MASTDDSHPPDTGAFTAERMYVMGIETLTSMCNRAHQGKRARLLDILESDASASAYGRLYDRLLSPRVILAFLFLYTVFFSGTVFSYVYTFLSSGLVAACCSISPYDLVRSDDFAISAMRKLQRAVWIALRLRVLIHFAALGSIAWALDLSPTAQALLAMSPPLAFFFDVLSRPRAWFCIRIYFGLL